MTDTIKNILSLILVIGTMYFVYTMVTAPVDDSGVDASVLAGAQAFMAHQATLNGVDLSLEIFNDPRFTTLVRFASPVEEQAVGRANLFIDSTTVAED